MSGLWLDVRHSLRRQSQRPGLTLVTVLTLGAALGVSTTLFAVLNTLFLQPWDVRDPDRMVVVRSTALSPDEWRHWAENARSFEGLTATLGRGAARLEGRRLWYELVSANYFDVLGVVLHRGRVFGAQDDWAGGTGSEAIVSHGFWRDRLSADPQVLGRSITLDGVAFTVVGVAARGFSGATSKRVDVWLPPTAAKRLRPPQASATAGSEALSLIVAGRLRRGISLVQARSELAALSAGFRYDRRLSEAPILVQHTDPLSQHPQGYMQQLMLGALLVAIGCAALVACSNIANLLLAQGYARRGEFAVRIALGASRARLVRRLLIESLLLAGQAGFLGLLIATLLPDAVFAGVPQIAERMALNFPLDSRVFGWALAVALLACVVFGLGPALQSTRIDVNHSLKDAHARGGASLRSALPGYQIAVSLIALVVGGLLVRSAQQAGEGALGYSVDGLTFVRVEMPTTYDTARRQRLAEEMFDRLRGYSSSRTLAAVNDDPFLDRFRQYLCVTPDYFKLTRVPIVAGRAFQPGDQADQVVILSEGFVQQFFGNENPVGTRLVSGPIPLPEGGFRRRSYTSLLEGRQVVGIARDANPAFLQSVMHIGYLPATPENWQVFVLRDSGVSQRPAIATTLARVNPGTHIEIMSGHVWLGQVMWFRLFFARVIAGIGGLALALAALGLFSLMTYSIEQRTREIGIRIALGADRRHIYRAVLFPAVRALLVGLALGSIGAGGAAFLLHRANLVLGLRPLDATTYLAVAVVLFVASLVASYFPMSRAIRVEPTVALRYE